MYVYTAAAAKSALAMDIPPSMDASSSIAKGLSTTFERMQVNMEDSGHGESMGRDSITEFAARVIHQAQSAARSYGP